MSTSIIPRILGTEARAETTRVPSPTEALALGWSIIPCDRNKKPLIPSWKPFQNRLPTPKELTHWTELHPSTWSVITGSISGRITLDFDGELGRRTLQSLGLAPHRITPSGGYHVDFKHPGWHVQTLNSKSKREMGQWWPGLDIRADGGYAVFRGSTERGEYQWLRDPQPYSLDVLPDDLREFLGLLQPPVITQKPPAMGRLHVAVRDGRVDTDLLVRRALDRVAGEGRNNAGLWLAIQLRDNGYSRMEAEAVGLGYAARCPATNTKGNFEPYLPDEVRATMHEVYSQPAREAWGAKKAPDGRAPRQSRHESKSQERAGKRASSPAPDLLGYLHNDHGNACRLIALYGEDLRYCYPLKKWLVWDGRWAADAIGHAKRLAKETMLEFLRQAIHLGKVDAEKFAQSCLDARRINSMLSMAECERYVRPEQLDVDPNLLNFRNGTVDLRSGVLCPHRRADYITKLVHHNFYPDAKCPLWQEFIDEVMGGGRDACEAAHERAQRFKDYLQRALGYSLTGSTIEKAVFVPFGSGDDGKSTLLSTFRRLIEEYAVVLQVDTLMVRQESNNTQADLADLRGARFVQTSETEEGQRLAQGKLKRITQGMGTIKAVRKYENPIEFKETHKLWIDTNHKPMIGDADDMATFKRLHPIPFTVRIPADRIDKRLPDKLIAEAEGILAWAVAGAKRWYECGLKRPPEVKAANDEWRCETDQLAQFIEECCVVGDRFAAQSSSLFGQYKRWCEDNGERTMNIRAFGKKFGEKGFEKRHMEKGAQYQRIALKAKEAFDGLTADSF